MALSDQQIDAIGREAIGRAQAGDFVAAEKLFAQVAQARPNSGQLQNLLGQARLKLGRFAEAREPLQRAAQFMPRDVAAQVNLAGCLSVLGDHAAALDALERAARLKPGDAIIAHNRGRALEALGRREDAERAYDEALSIDHRLLASLSARASLLAARGDWMGALADLDMALTSRPNDAALLVRRGELLLRQGDWLRGLGDHEARLELPGRYAPSLPRWQGEPLAGRLLVYPEQADIESDAAICDTLMLARGIADATLETSGRIAGWFDGPTVRRGAPLDGFAAAAPLRSLPHLLGWTLQALPPAPPLTEEAAASHAAAAAVGDSDSWPVHLAARLGIATTLRLGPDADWLWGPGAGPSPWYPALVIERT